MLTSIYQLKLKWRPFYELVYSVVLDEVNYCVSCLLKLQYDTFKIHAVSHIRWRVI